MNQYEEQRKKSDLFTQINSKKQVLLLKELKDINRELAEMCIRSMKRSSLNTLIGD